MSVFDIFLGRLVAPLAFRLMHVDPLSRLAWLRSTESWPTERRESWRLTRLNAIIAYCWDHVPFYRTYWADHGVRRRPLGSIGELNAFPELTKDLIRNHWTDLHSNEIARIRNKLNATSGSTGEPIRYYQDLELWSLSQAFNLWGWGLAGYRFGDRVAVIGGYALVPGRTKWRDKIRCTLERKLPISGAHFDDDTAAVMYSRLTSFAPAYLYGYPSVLFMLASFLRRERLQLASIRGVFTTAEMLQPNYRQGVEKGFGCAVWDQYGCNDGGLMSHECALQCGHHYNDLQAIAQTTEEDETGVGRLLITNLWNRSFPFIRYDNGDRIRLAEERCPCGSSFPMIQVVQGRTADILTFANGRQLSGPALTLIFPNLAVEGWQLVQTGPSRLEVRVLARDGLSAGDRAHIEKVLYAHLGQGVEVYIRRVEVLERTAAGKLKPIWSEVD